MNEYITTGNETTMLAIKDIVDFVATLDTRITLGQSETTSVFDYHPIIDGIGFWFNYTDMLEHATDEGSPRLETIKGLVIHGQVLKGTTGDMTEFLPVELQGIHNIAHVVTDDPESLGLYIEEEPE